MVLATAMSAVLVAGLASALNISTRSVTGDDTASAESSRSSLVLSQLASDLRLALSFSERTSSAVTFKVPDRTSDGAVDTIRYAWSGAAGAPLTYQLNGGAVINVATNVQRFNVAALTRTIAATSCIVPQTVAVYVPAAEAKTSAATTSLTVAAPSGMVPGNLMVAAVVVDGQHAAITSPAGWTSLGVVTDSAGAVTLGVWWKLAEASESSSYAFSWTASKRAYAWITRFSGVEPSAPINGFTAAAGSAATSAPSCPSVTTNVANAMIVRIGGFDHGDVTIDSPGVSGHTTITMDESDTGSSAVSGGAAYVLQAAAGASGTAAFGLTASEENVTFTVAIAPDDGI